MKAIIWDLDGTLIDSYKVIVESICDELKELNIEYNKFYIANYVQTKSVTSYLKEISQITNYSTEYLFNLYYKYSDVRTKEINYLPNAKVELKYAGQIDDIDQTDWIVGIDELVDVDKTLGEYYTLTINGEEYDIYYSVFQNGNWTDLVMNGEKAGIEGCGLRIDGLRIAVKKKGAGIPEEPKLIFENIDPNKPMIALTYDDGPSAATSKILDVLEKNKAKATFYMVGNRMERYKDIINRMQTLNCELGSHTWNHSYLTKLSKNEIHENLNKFDSNLQNITGIKSVTMRPPGGFVSNSVQSALESYGQPIILWSIDTLDWKTRNAKRQFYNKNAGR